MIIQCFECGKPIEITFSSFKKDWVSGVCQDGNSHAFCKDCYEKYKERFAVETYKNQKIYKFDNNNKILYKPYFDCMYGFENIDDCKRRMDSCVAIVPEEWLNTSE